MTNDHLVAFAWIVIVSGIVAVVLQGFLFFRALKVRSRLELKDGSVEHVVMLGETITSLGMFSVAILSFLLGLAWGGAVLKLPPISEVVDIDPTNATLIPMFIARNLILTGLAIHGMIYWVQLRRVVAARLARDSHATP